MKRAVAHLIPYIEAEKLALSAVEGETLGGNGEGQSRSNGKVLLATVKGDVHDIGKNIVGVVLQCNNYEVIDLGVMVPSARILETARKEQVDIIGLSGLITPSLEEMSFVAGELEREGFTLPLLIGGATTSRVHTAVKIEPRYRGPTVHVVDASRAVGVAGNLRNDELRPKYVATVKAEYQEVRTQRGDRKAEQRKQPVAEARRNRLSVDWSAAAAPEPCFLGVRPLRNYPSRSWSRSSIGRRSSKPGSWPDTIRPSWKTRPLAPRPGVSSAMPTRCFSESWMAGSFRPTPFSGFSRPTVLAMISRSIPTSGGNSAER